MFLNSSLLYGPRSNKKSLKHYLHVLVMQPNFLRYGLMQNYLAHDKMGCNEFEPD